ncbi:MAG: hypothetical protein KUG78_15590 [Kangiellaceae bacterium]|nr:hypothetical protein [Kangiellaceae bacterium]
MEESIIRGLEFIEKVSTKLSTLKKFAPDILFLLNHIAITSDDSNTRTQAKTTGKRLAKLWREHQTVPRNIEKRFSMLIADQAAEELGIVDTDYHYRLHSSFSKTDVYDILGFDPKQEPPPIDIPDKCGFCGFEDVRGKRFCKVCRKKLIMIDPYDVWVNALIFTHHLKLYGPIERDLYEPTVSWINVMRPYPTGNYLDSSRVFHAAYAVTHVVYTLSNYHQSQITPAKLKPEIVFLKKMLKQALQAEDCDLLGECIDSLSALAMSKVDLKSARDFLISAQNIDGSWGTTSDILHRRIHTTWTAMDAIRSYRVYR